MGNINIDLPKEVHRQLKAQCALSETTIEAYITQALKRRLKTERIP